jgi:hypothetical protein
VKDVLENYEVHKDKLAGVSLEDNAERLIAIYQRLSNGG